MADNGEFDARPVRAFLPGPDVRVDESVWPASVPALAQVLRDLVRPSDRVRGRSSGT